MSAVQLLGKPLAGAVTAEVRTRLAALGAPLHLVSVVASGDPATLVYVESKRRQARRLGVELGVRDLGADVSQVELHRVLTDLSDDPEVQGVVLELPLSAHLDPDAALRFIAHPKDIEGLTPANLALVSAGREAEALLPPTPRSVRFLLREVLELRGARIAIIGPGRTVGRPLAWMLNNRGATVTLCNEFTRDLGGLLAVHDAVVVAVGRAGLLKSEQVQPHHVVVDAGINVTASGVVGDVAPEVADIVRAYSPVPGGVGPLTSALMFQNLVRAVRLQRGEKVE